MEPDLTQNGGLHIVYEITVGYRCNFTVCHEDFVEDRSLLGLNINSNFYHKYIKYLLKTNAFRFD